MSARGHRESAELARAYSACEAITRRRAGNFYYGIRLLPPLQRRAMCAVYAFARRIDDIGDGTLASAQKVEQLESAERQLAALRSDAPLASDGDAVMMALADAGARFALPQDALSELIEGVRMDVAQTRYERFEELVVYCRRVAGGIGRLCLAIFRVREPAPPEPRASSLADDLGVALQLTNILRDVREDARNSRVYLPAQELRRFGVLREHERRPPAQVLLSDEPEVREALCELMRFQAERAQGWFERGIALAPLLDGRSAACVLAMGGIYRRVLARIEAAPARALAARVSLPAWEKAWVAGRSVLASEVRARRGRLPGAGAIGRST